MTPKKVGILGGTFDPIHIGHLIMANEAFHALSLDEVRFMANATPPQEMYVRFDELHKQRTFSIDTYKSWLEAAGFAVDSVTADFSSTNGPDTDSERVFFTCIKK